MTTEPTTALKSTHGKTNRIRTVAVVGAGTMGSGIAQKAAMAGARVILVDQAQACIDKAKKSISDLLAEGQKRHVLSPQDAGETLGRMSFGVDLAALKDADLVIEAIYENEKAKSDLFASLEKAVCRDVIFATNTSSLSVKRLALATQRPERFVGMHYFFHPVKNRLVEIIPIDATAPEVLESIMAFSNASGRIPILVKDSPGFAVNRFFVPWLNEAVRLLEEGAAGIPTIEEAAKRAFGIGMGPFALMNATGVPIAVHAADGLARDLGAFYEPAEKLKKLAADKKTWDLAGDIAPAKLKAVQDRLWGVVFWVASTLAEEGAARIEDIDRGAKIGLRWEQGPFEAMNTRGVAEAAALVKDICGKYGSHIPKNIQAQASSKRAWPLSFVDFKVEGRLAKIVINRPESMNALSQELVTQLAGAFDRAQKAPDTDAITLEGRGKAFMAGADIKFFVRSLEKDDLDAVHSFTAAGAKLLRRIETSEKPVIALLDGAALGGGTELALACKWRIASPKALLMLPETGLGIFPGLGGTQRLPRLIGKRLAKYFILTGAPIPAPLALDLGLVEAVVAAEGFAPAVEALLKSGGRPGGVKEGTLAPIKALFSDENVKKMLAGRLSLPGDAPAEKTVKNLSRRGPVALKIADELIDQGLDLEIDAALELELSRIREIFKTADAREGLTAILEKRRPVFKGK